MKMFWIVLLVMTAQVYARDGIECSGKRTRLHTNEIEDVQIQLELGETLTLAAGTKDSIVFKVPLKGSMSDDLLAIFEEVNGDKSLANTYVGFGEDTKFVLLAINNDLSASGTAFYYDRREGMMFSFQDHNMSCKLIDK